VEIEMCNSCSCENNLKCSIKGFQPTGWCCEHCNHYSLTVVCETQSIELKLPKERKGYCLGCQKSEVGLTWIYLKTQKGFCKQCISQYDKLKLLDIVIGECEG
jgi:hypothetical protein